MITLPIIVIHKCSNLRADSSGVSWFAISIEPDPITAYLRKNSYILMDCEHKILSGDAL